LASLDWKDFREIEIVRRSYLGGASKEKIPTCEICYGELNWTYNGREYYSDSFYRGYTHYNKKEWLCQDCFKEL